MKRWLLLLLVFCLLLGTFGCAGTQTPEEEGSDGEVAIQNVGTLTPVSGNARAYYQIFVGSFSDSDGDGIGDLRGIINRLDYLNDGDDNSGKSLGVEGIWLSPIFLAPSYHKYDVMDYYKVDHRFGTEADLRELIELCHSRNVQIILDLVINHTSLQHPWFDRFEQAHQEGDTENPYYEYYTYAAEPVNGRIFKEMQGTGEYYECNFSEHMPELNFDNPTVRQEMVALAKYYLDMGVDGFRFDAAKYIYFGEEARNVEFWDWYMGQLRAIKPDIYTVAEVWDADFATTPYFSSTNCFNFTMSQNNGQIARAAREGNVNSFVYYVSNYIQSIKEQNPDAMPITFIANHDMDRAAGFLPVENGLAKVAANLSMLMPGSSYIYYGEEIGLKGSRGGATTDANRRLAMLWGDNDTVKDPTGANYKGEQTNGTVVSQLSQADSLYNHYKKLILLRKANPEIANGTYTPLKLLDSGKAGGFLSTYQGASVAVIHNTQLEAVTIDISKCSEITAMAIAAYVGVGSATLEGTMLTIEAQTSVVLR